MPSWAELAKPAPRRVPPVTLAPLKPVRSFAFNLTCPACGHHLELVTNGKTDRLTTRAVTNCPPCRRRWMITVRLDPVDSVVQPRGPRAKPTKT